MTERDQELLDMIGQDALHDLDEMVQVVAEQLGESPEAWRGAGVMCQVLITTLVNHEDNVQQAMITAGLIAGRLRTHPAMLALFGPTSE